jgi:hypothetical protein
VSAATTAIRGRVPQISPVNVALVAAAAIAAALFVVSISPSGASLERYGAVVVLLALAVWMFFSERYEVTLAVLLLYLGLLDGFLKLKTGSSIVTLGRDVLLYAIAGGAVVRSIIRHQAPRLPKITALVLLWVAICLAEVLNPVVPSISHAVAGVRQHIEFVPLFFLGYAVMRSERRLLGLLALILGVAAANGLVSLVQSHLSPAQLAAWGPGYASDILGTAFQSGRTFVTAAGQSFVRPPALGSDLGFGGVVAAMAVPGALALAAAGGEYRRYLPLVGGGVVLVVVGLATSQSRTAVVTAAVAILVFMALSVTSRRGLTVVVMVAALSLVSYVGVTTVFKGVTSAPNRYASIAPTKAIATTVSYRQRTLELIPSYLADYPLGDGIGNNGPAGGSAVGGRTFIHLDAESEPTFLIAELGAPGLLVMLVITLYAIKMGVALRVVEGRRLQLALAALTAVFISLFVTWVVGVDSANSPSSPFIWLALGTLSYWYEAMRSGRLPTRSGRLRATLALR